MRTERASASTISTGFRRRISGNEPLRQPRGEKHIGEIARKAPLDARPQDFDRDVADRLAVLHTRTMHLRDRSGCDRLAEFNEQRFELGAKGRLDRRHRDGARIGRHPVLQPFKLLDDFGADDVGAGRDELSELYIGRAEAVDCGREALEAFGAAPREKVGDREGQPGERRQDLRIDCDESALARQHETGPGETGAMAKSSEGPQI